MKTEKKQRLKGSVLFTVVSVMSLLVIFLMGTLVLATSASNRSHKNYSSSQAEYTARAAIESFSQAMGRNAGVAQTVVSMGEYTSIQPTVRMENSEMGSVGYYDDSGVWVDDKINVEYITKTYVYADSQWEEQQVLKVTATARVGKEESTVSAYIRKKAPNEPNPLSIKGFQTLGGGGFTTTSGYVSGAVSMGILDDGNQTYNLNNDSVYDTEISFVNGTLNVGAQIDILASKVGSGTVVMGDLNASNGNGLNIIVDYPYAQRSSSTDAWEYVDMTHKNIPYLYVDDKLNISNKFTVTASGVNTVTQLRNGAPFNIFCGSLNHTGNNINVTADIYIMGIDMNGDGKSDTSSTFGTTAGTSRLNAWTASVTNKTDTQFYSEGGSIYSNENLTLGQAVIRGDVHVNGDLNISSNSLIIYGDLVVTGSINKTPEDLAAMVRGDIYNGNNAQIGTGGLKEGYFMKENTFVSGDYIKPGYVKVQNFEYANAALENIAQQNFVRSNFAQGLNVDRIDTTYYDLYSDVAAANEGMAPLEKIVLKQSNPNATWEHFTDDNGNSYADVEIYDEKGNIINDSAIQASWSGEYNANVRIMYRIGNEYYVSEPYYDVENNRISYVESTSRLYFTDGTYVDYIPENVTIYKADKDGNMTNTVTDKLYTIYQADVNGNLTDVETDEYTSYYEVDNNGNALNPAVLSTEKYSYFVPDQFGNATETRSNSQSIIYRADINGNATEEITTENYTYYSSADPTTPVAESVAMGSSGTDGTYLAWYDANVKINAPFCYYSADPTGHETDTAWLTANSVSEAEAFESVAVYPISAYTGAGKEVYPSKMTREEITKVSLVNGKIVDGANKIITTLTDIQTSIGYSAAAAANGGTGFDANTYYTEVPGSGGKYTGFDKINLSTLRASDGPREITGNAHITGATQSNGEGEVTININPGGDSIWVVLDNCTFYQKVKVVVNGTGTVNFLIKGDIAFNMGSSIYSKSVYDQITAGGNVIVREDDMLNINYYGAQNSSISMANNCMLCGIAKCPYTKLALAETAGLELADPRKFVYISSEGISTQYKQVGWIGNALFKEKSGGNNFTLLYTGSGASDSDIDNELLKQSWKIMYYDVY